VTWQVQGTTFAGVCLHQDDVLAVHYVTDGDSQSGLVLYRIGADGVLRGVWTATGAPGQGTETLTPGR
jgi:hypothetical protein